MLINFLYFLLILYLFQLFICLYIAYSTYILRAGVWLGTYRNLLYHLFNKK